MQSIILNQWSKPIELHKLRLCHDMSEYRSKASDVLQMVSRIYVGTVAVLAQKYTTSSK